ncbi:MAG TPA: hypothetical protein VGR42_19135, partial [Casimicrobiaceae bacterium]|nr:hypothetical protein [Casimicrobiaceae bacterium]
MAHFNWLEDISDEERDRNRAAPRAGRDELDRRGAEGTAQPDLAISRDQQLNPFVVGRGGGMSLGG